MLNTVQALCAKAIALAVALVSVAGILSLVLN